MKGQNRVISSDQPSAYERWELPAMKAEGSVMQVSTSRAAPTASQLEELQGQAYAEGFSAGRKEGFEQGHREGFAKGFEKGHQAGSEAADAEARPRIERLGQLLHALAEPLQSLDDAVEESLVHLAIAIARQLVRRELKADPGQVVAVIREALSALPVSSRNVRLYLHPEDAHLVRETLTLDTQESPSWEMLEDPMLTRGGCRVESDSSRIDASVEGRIASVIAHVLGGERKGD